MTCIVFAVTVSPTFAFFASTDCTNLTGTAVATGKDWDCAGVDAAVAQKVRFATPKASIPIFKASILCISETPQRRAGAPLPDQITE
jgi:hypothetical protein